MSLYSSLTQVLAPFAAKINGLLTGWDGTRYSTPGEAVRQQISDLHVLIGDVPGTAIQASAVAYGDSDVGTELANVNGRLQEQADDISELQERKTDGLTNDIKNAILACFRSIPISNTLYEELYIALYPPVSLTSISAVYTQSGRIEETNELSDLIKDLVVTAHWDDGTRTAIGSAQYTLSGTLVSGTSTITVSYGGKTTTFDVVVTGLEWHTAELSDFAYSQVNSARAFVRGYNNSEEPSLLIPNELDGSPVEINCDWPNANFDAAGALENLKLSPTTFGKININSTNNTFKRFYGEGGAISNLTINSDALVVVDLENCDNLSGVVIHSSSLKKLPKITSTKITSISDAFSRCSSLTDESDFVIPPNCVDINQAFRNCMNLEKAPVFDHVFTRYGVVLDGTNVKNVTITSLEFNPHFEMFGTIADGATYRGEPFKYWVYLNSAFYKWYRNFELKGGRDINTNVVELLDNNVNLKRIVFYGDSYLNYETKGAPNPQHGMIVPYLGLATEDQQVELCNYAVGGASSGTEQEQFNRHADRYDLPTVIWLGQNDRGVSYTEATVKNIREMTDQLTGDYIVLGLLEYNWEGGGRSQALKEAFGDHYYDPREYLMANCWDIIGKTPTAEEAEQIANNQMPLLFFGTEAVPHPRVWACQIVSKMLYDIFLARGWITNNDATAFGKNTRTNISATALTVSVGNTATLTASAANDESITWVSTDDSIATVADGVVTGVSAGECYVVARAGYFSKFCTVTVS